jgi:hypothetical protein
MGAYPVMQLRFLLLFVLACGEGCNLAPDQEVTVLLPAPPAAWQIAFPRLGFSVVTTDPGKGARVVSVESWRDTPSLPCGRAPNTPVLAFPLPAAQLRPAGGFYPASLRTRGNGAVLELSWEDGPAALVMFRVIAQGLDPSLFNVPKLSRYLKKHPDPWNVDLDAVAQKILRGDLTAWDIDLLPCRDADVESGPGTWFLESPFSSSFDAINGRVTLPEISMGNHRLFSLGGTSWSMQVGASEVVMLRDADDPGPGEDPH